MEQGKIHIYYGDGKGKTTAALGLGLRAWGRGFSVLLVPFLKGADSGEYEAVRALPRFDLVEPPEKIKFLLQMNPQEREECRRQTAERLEQAARRTAGGGYGLLILDEVLDAVGCGLVPEERLMEILRDRPSALEVVLTGRNPSKELLSLADYVTEMQKRKHPYDRGCPARVGIER